VVLTGGKGGIGSRDGFNFADERILLLLGGEVAAGEDGRALEGGVGEGEGVGQVLEGRHWSIK
jgi:hypothetical protein